MKQNATEISISLLRWTLGLVVLLESARFAFSASAAHSLAKAGLPEWIRPVLGGGEMFAAILFLVPYTCLIGGYALIVIFALAVLIHLLHGQFDVAWLAVYGVAAAVIVAHRREKDAESRIDGR
jgi:hypothetical protein